MNKFLGKSSRLALKAIQFPNLYYALLILLDDLGFHTHFVKMTSLEDVSLQLNNKISSIKRSLQLKSMGKLN